MKDLKGNITTRTDSINKWVTLCLLSVAAVSTCFGGGAIIMKYTNIHCTTCIDQNNFTLVHFRIGTY